MSGRSMIDPYIAELMKAQGREIDKVIEAKMRAGRNVFEKVCLRVELRYGTGPTAEWRRWYSTKVSSTINVRVVDDPLSWHEFQTRARALRAAGAL